MAAMTMMKLMIVMMMMIKELCWPIVFSVFGFKWRPVTVYMFAAWFGFCVSLLYLHDGCTGVCHHWYRQFNSLILWLKTYWKRMDQMYGLII